MTNLVSRIHSRWPMVMGEALKVCNLHVVCCILFLNKLLVLFFSNQVICLNLAQFVSTWISLGQVKNSGHRSLPVSYTHLTLPTKLEV